MRRGTPPFRTTPQRRDLKVGRLDRRASAPSGELIRKHHFHHVRAVCPAAKATAEESDAYRSSR